jgi:hypothetical protein
MLKEGRKWFRVCFARAFQTERVGRGRWTNGPGIGTVTSKGRSWCGKRTSGFRRPEVSPPLPCIYKSTANFGQVPFGRRAVFVAGPPHGLRRKDAIN